MTLVRANVGGWGLFEILTSGQMNTIDSQLPFAIDGNAGGAYATSAQIEIDGVSVASGATLRLLAPTGDVSLDIEANSTSVVGGVNIDVTALTRAILITGTEQDDGSALPPAIDVTGWKNTTGPGVTAINVLGGIGGTAGGGGDGINATGGIGSVVTEISGIGVIGVGGETTGAEDPDIGDAAGVLGQGGSNAGSIDAAHGVVGLGGSSNNPLGAGNGGRFIAVEAGTGVVAVGGPEALSSGVVGSGRAAGIIGNGVTAGVGGIFTGAGAGTPAVESKGAINFDSAAALEKNPAAGTNVLNRLYAKNCIKAWGYAIDGVLQDGFNVASMVRNTAGSAFFLLVTFAEAMDDANYVVVTTPINQDATGNGELQFQAVNYDISGEGVVPTAAAFQLIQYRDTGTPVTVDQNDSEIHFAVLGEQ